MWIFYGLGPTFPNNIAKVDDDYTEDDALEEAAERAYDLISSYANHFPDPPEDEDDYWEWLNQYTSYGVLYTQKEVDELLNAKGYYYWELEE